MQCPRVHPRLDRVGGSVQLRLDRNHGRVQLRLDRNHGRVQLRLDRDHGNLDRVGRIATDCNIAARTEPGPPASPYF